MEKKNNKKIFIIIGCILVIVVAIIVGTIVLKKDNNVTNNDGNSTENTEQKEETKKSDYSALENDIKKAINEKDLIKASSYYNVLKFSIENDKNADRTEYDKITNDLQTLKDERKTELLAKVDSKYDDMTNNTSYLLKGSENVFDEEVNLIPILVYSTANKMPVFGLQLGFVNESWIFFESLIVNVDGDLTEISSNYYDKTKEVITGGVFERCTLYTEKYPTFNTLVEKMIKGNEIKVRFVGKAGKGNIDHVVTASEKEHLKVLYELSLCL